MKRLVAVAGAGAIALALSACGPTVERSDDEGAASGEEPAATGETDWSTVEPADQISFWSNHPSGSIDLEKEIIANFEAETGIKVDLVTAGANYNEVSQKFQTAQVSGDAGDLVVLSDTTWFPAYLNGSITPLDEILEAAGNDTSTYHDSFYEDYLYEGSHYAVPYARSTILFFYNKDHYAAAGVADETPATWDDVKEASLKIKDAGVSDTPFGYPSDTYFPSWTMSNLVWGYGGDWSDGWDFSAATSEATVAAMQFAQDSITDGWGAVLSGDPTTDFSAGAVSQILASTGGLRGILDTADFEVGIGFLPGGPVETEKVVPTGGAGVGIASNSTPEKQLAAAMFATYLTNPENTAFFSGGTGYLPVQKDADMSAVYADNPQFEIAVDELPMTRSQNFARVLVPGGAMVLDQGIMKILVNSDDVVTTLEGVETELQSIFDRDLKATVN
ncbi:ABC transporter substrate-binding protein [Actinomyces minihominis]|uniref:ABC transporter substrate-binding protein n=1 Tax=Actinomyces minihominis TaxID=2002838 RepID=UPI0013EC3FF7|nr:ABC transporter substrate-binding protein [Actinomyces minihominis]